MESASLSSHSELDGSRNRNSSVQDAALQQDVSVCVLLLKYFFHARVRTILVLGVFGTAQHSPLFGCIGYWAISLLAVISNTDTAQTS